MKLTTYKNRQSINGITYHKLISQYDGDVTKNCSLLETEIDSNVYFLRGNDIADVQWNEENKTLYLIKENGEKIIIPNTSGKGSYFDYETNTFHLILNGIDYPITNFMVENCCDELIAKIECLEEYVSGVTEEIFSIIENIDFNLIQNIFDTINNNTININNLQLEVADLQTKIDSISNIVIDGDDI